MKLPKVEQRFFYSRVSHRGCRLPCHDHNVQTTIEHRFMQSVTFPHQPRDPMPHDAVAHLLADADSNPVPSGAIFHDIHDQIFVCIRFTVLVNGLELLILLKAFRKFHWNSFLFLLILQRKRPHFCDLSGQSRSSFCTSGR